MKNDNGREKIVDVDDSIPIDYGGFGTVFSLPSQPSLIVKRVDLSPPQPIGNIRGYVAHIRTTKERLLSIKSDEERQPHPRYWIFDYIDEIVEQSLSTHWWFERSGLHVGAVWFLQKVAPGRQLLALLREEPPTSWKRIVIAKDVVSRMRTLRRADLVHLDCVPDNIFIDIANQKTTLIDLDGCGVVRRRIGAKLQPDEWEHPPSTLGHLRSVRPPAWYPQPGVQSGPKAGNYLFAERWVVLDTIIRILTWNRASILSWLDSDIRKDIVNGYGYITKVIDSAMKEGVECTYEDWIKLQERILTGLRNQFDYLPTFFAEDFEDDDTYPSCLDYFANLAQEACLDPRVLSSDNGSPYEIYRQKLNET
jgi:hypothetical protein